MRAAPEPPSGDGRGPRAVYAVRRLLPDHVRAPSIKMRATSMGGSNGQTYRVDVPEQRSNGESVQESYFVRVLPAGYEANAWNVRFAESCVANTVAASDAGVTAAVLAADEAALVQQFIPSARVETTAWRNTLEDHADARRFGAMVAAIHAVPYPDPSAPLAPHCFYCWYDMPEWYARDPPLLSCWEYLDAREPPPGVGGEVVFTHGDLHNKNVLVSLADGGLVPVDFELSGRGHRAFDLAFFFWHWSPNFVAKPYPCFPARQAVARAYLAASGLPAYRDDVCDLLYAVEYCIPRVALSRANHVGPDMRQDYLAHLPVACKILRRAAVGDEDVRDAVIEQGILPLAAQGCIPGEDGPPLWDLGCTTPCTCS